MLKTGKRALRYCLIPFLLLSLVSCGTMAPATAPTQQAADPPPAAPTQPAADPPEGREAQSAGAGVEVSFRYSPALAENVQVQAVEAVPLTSGGPYWAAHPAYLHFQFVKGGGQASALATAQIMVYRTDYFDSFGDQATGFARQLQELSDLLREQPDLSRFIEQRSSSNTPQQPFLPFLPWQNAAQVFCVQPHYVKFEGGSGIAYLTAFSQGIGQVTEAMVLYTFQGLTDDGSAYISAVFPVATGVLPATAGELPQVDPEQLANQLKAQLADQVATLNAQAPGSFQPSLEMIDQMVESIVVQ